MATINMDDRRGFANRVCRKFDKFWQWKLPCPVDPVAIYRAAYTDKEWIAMRFLHQHKRNALALSTTFKMHWADKHYVHFTFPKGMKFPDFGVHLDDLPEPMQRKIRVWLTSCNRFRQLRDELKRRVNGVMGNPNGEGKFVYNRKYKDLDPRVNTPKQLYRLWPELQPMFLKDWKREIQLQSVRSPMPRLLGYRMVRGEPSHSRFVTPEQFRCEDSEATKYEKQSFKEINDILLMVSLAGDVPHVKDFPTITGDL